MSIPSPLQATPDATSRNFVIAPTCRSQEHLTADVVVIGAGVVGAACAYSLALRGLSVHLVERDAPARGTSGACEGNLVLWDRPTLADLQLARWSHERWAELSEELRESVGIDIEFDRKGSLMLLADEADAAAAEEKCAWLAAQGVEFEWLDERALAANEPCVRGGIAAAAYFPRDAQIEPRLATAALVAAARARGAVVHNHEPVLRIEVGVDGAPVAVTTPVHRIACEWAVAAAGVWSPALLDGLADLPVTARKGQIAVLAGAPVTVRHKIMEASYFRTVASGDAGLQVATVIESTRAGSILVGSSRLVTHADDRLVDLDVLAQMVARAVEFVPGLASGRVIRSYAGVRPMSPDHTPIIGPLGNAPRIVVATGHEGGGVMMAAATGEVVAQHIASEEMRLPLEPYLPTRFASSQIAS